MAPNEELYREHSTQDLATLNRWLIVLLCAVVKHQGSSVLTLAKGELDLIDKGWALDYAYDDEARTVTLSVRQGPYTETYVVGSRVTSWARQENPELERLKQPLRSATLSNEEIAKLERQARLEQIAREMEMEGSEGWASKSPNASDLDELLENPSGIAGDILREIGSKFNHLIKKNSRAQAYQFLQQALMEHMDILVPAIIPLKDHIATITELEEYLKGSMGTSQKPPLDALAEWLQGKESQ